MAAGTIFDMSEKVTKYEEFLNERLRPDLKKVMDEDDKICSDIANCDQLKLFLTQVKDKSFGYEDGRLKVMTDLGCNFYAEAVVEDTTKVNVYLGLGTYLEMPIDEAINYMDKRKVILEEKRKGVNSRITLINAHIKLVMEGLRELQNLSNSTDWSPPEAFA